MRWTRSSTLRSSIKHIFYVNVLPRQYIEHLEREHCQLDEPAVQELTDHYNRPWDRAGGELLPSYGTRLDEEQQQLAVDGVVITDADKHRRYMLEIYGSGVFSVETITQWTERPPPNGPTPSPEPSSKRRCEESRRYNA